MAFVAAWLEGPVLDGMIVSPCEAAVAFRKETSPLSGNHFNTHDSP